MTMPGTTANPDMSLRELAQWAEGEGRRLAAHFGLDPAADGDRANFVLAQAVKLGEEVGELHAEVLGALKYQRREKGGQYNSDTLRGELADVMVCVALLAEVLDVDLAWAVSSKIEHLDARNRQAEITE
jgi:NTP pyrophosphatase (non-canonical NTP hydrolase)